MYWLSATSPGSLEATTIELPLSADPVSDRNTSDRVDCGRSAPNQRTMPPDALLLAFYLQPDGTAVADFSDALSAEIPSGIQNEQLVVDSIAQTLGANVESDSTTEGPHSRARSGTLAGHLDLSGVFPVSSASAVAAPVSQIPDTRQTKQPRRPCTSSTDKTSPNDHTRLDCIRLKLKGALSASEKRFTVNDRRDRDGEASTKLPRLVQLVL